MKKTLVTIALIAIGTQAFAESYRIQLSSKDRFKVAAPSKWNLEQKKQEKNKYYEFVAVPKDNSFVLKMFFMKDNGKLSSPEKIKARLVFGGKAMLEGSVESSVNVKEYKLKKRHGFYSQFTDKETVKRTNPEPNDFLYTTRGYIRISDDSVLGFWMLTHKTEGEVYEMLEKYLFSYIK